MSVSSQNFIIKNKNIFIVYLILVLNAGLITLFLKPTDILSNDPIYTDDYAMHFSECLSARRFLTSEVKLWGYDPFLLAGFPRGVLHPDIIAWEIFFTVLSPVFGDGLAFKLYLLLFLLFYPICIYLASRNFGFATYSGIISMIMGILFFNLSLAIDLVAWGMVSYVAACYISVYVLSIYYKLITSFKIKYYIYFIIWLSLLQSIHVLATAHLIIPFIIIYAYYVKRLQLYRHILIIAIPFFVILSNSFWIINLVNYFEYKTQSPENYDFTLQIDSIFEFFNVYIDQRKGFNYKPAFLLNNTFMDVFLMVFGIYGLWLWRNRKEFFLVWPFLLAIICTLGLAYCGSKTPLIAQLQPERFNIALGIILLIPAGFSLSWGLAQILNRPNRPLFILLLSAFLIFAYPPMIRPFIIIIKHGLYRLNCEFPVSLLKVTDFLKITTTPVGRVLLEDSEFSREGMQHEYCGGHFPGLFPEYVKREFLCGPRPMYPIKHSYASFANGVLFEKSVEDYTQQELKDLFELYNVKWIVCWYEKSKNVFDNMPGFINFIRQIDKFSIYEVNRKPSFFVKGNGTVESDYNMLRFDNIIPEDDEIVLSYHWLDVLYAIPELSIERVFIGADPIGFIKVINPPKSFVIINGY